VDASNPKLTEADIKYYCTLKHIQKKFTWCQNFTLQCLQAITCCFLLVSWPAVWLIQVH